MLFWPFNKTKLPKEGQKVWLISGPSSAGKSTFLLDPVAEEICGIAKDTPVVMARKFGKKEIQGDFAVHYNILWPASRNVSPYDFENDPAWQNILKAKENLQAVVIKTSKKIIFERVSNRTIVESEQLGQKERKYKKDKWLTIYERVKLKKLYKSWIKELKRNGIPYIVVDGNDKGFAVIKNHLNDAGK